jgi:hypothetical protein
MDTEITPKFIYLTLIYKAYVNMKVMVIHDTSSYDNTGTYQISCTANVVQQLNNSKLKVSLYGDFSGALHHFQHYFSASAGKKKECIH